MRIRLERPLIFFLPFSRGNPSTNLGVRVAFEHREKKLLVALFASRCEIVLLLPSIDITGEENVEDLDIEKKKKKIYLFIYLYFLIVISLQGF